MTDTTSVIDDSKLPQYLKKCMYNYSYYWGTFYVLREISVLRANLALEEMTYGLVQAFLRVRYAIFTWPLVLILRNLRSKFLAGSQFSD